MCAELRQRKAPGLESVTEKLPEISWKDVAKHNTEQDAWVTVNDHAYDVTEFVGKHPGGKELLLSFAGRESTVPFMTYHCFSYQQANARKALAPYLKAKVIDSEFEKYPEENNFYQEVTNRVESYFTKNKIDPKYWLWGVLNWAFMVGSGIASMAVVYGLFDLPVYAKIFAAVLFGWFQALPLLHTMHDCSHGALSHSPLVWDILGVFTMDVYAGVSMTAWHLQHVVGHHVWTNVFGTDPDLPQFDEGDPRRLVHRQKNRALYAYQQWYLPIAYGSLALKVRWTDITHAFGPEKAGNIRIRNHSTAFYVTWFLKKSVWLFWRVYLPLVILEVDPALYAGLWLLSDAITGWYLAFNFQVSHISTEADYPLGDVKSPNVSDEWAISQIRTSVDYSHGDSFMTWLAGALNYQTVHHLFPGVSQYHYPAIAPIIMEYAKEQGVKYNCLDGFWSAFFAHVAHLKEMGLQGKPVTVHMG